MNIRKDKQVYDKNTRESMDRRWKVVRKIREDRLRKKEIKLSQEQNGPCPSQPKEKLIQLAKDIHGNLVFTDRHVRNASDLGSVFMVLLLMDPKDMYIPESLGMFYEYMSQAGPIAVNGYPTFFSLHMLNREDTEFVWNKVAKIEQLMNELDK